MSAIQYPLHLEMNHHVLWQKKQPCWVDGFLSWSNSYCLPVVLLLCHLVISTFLTVSLQFPIIVMHKYNSFINDYTIINYKFKKLGIVLIPYKNKYWRGTKFDELVNRHTIAKFKFCQYFFP